jgi:hypothetical protein
MSTMWNPPAAQQILNRIGRLTPDHTGAWGRMTASAMVCHVADTLKMALGELPVSRMKAPVRYPPLKQLVVYWAPFPKHAPTAPELTGRPPTEWVLDLAELQGLLRRVCAQGADANAPWPAHPAFGRLSRRAWGVHIYRHIDHHLRQFGV